MSSGHSVAELAVEPLLRHMLTIDASDLYLTAECPPVYRVNGVGHAGRQPLSAAQVDRLADAMMTGAQRDEFRANCEMNFALAFDAGRFRVNVFRQRGATGMVVRLIKTAVPTLDALGHPAILKDVARAKRGLVLVVGATGSGKSTTLAAMIDHRNETDTGHIVTIEDPVEFYHPHKRCVVTQREVGVDTRSYGHALRNVLRQAPDVVLVGEIRDAESMEAALTLAETGHLCFSTLHSNNANQTLERVLNFFPSSRHPEVLTQLSLNVRAIIAQRLIPTKTGGRAAALEILIDTPRVKALLKRGEVEDLKDAMKQSEVEGGRTFDEALFALVTSGRVAPEVALANADSANDLRLRVERHYSGVNLDEGAAPLRFRADPRGLGTPPEGARRPPPVPPSPDAARARRPNVG